MAEERVPWLWWGMYWTDAEAGHTPALSRFFPFLDVHLCLLEVVHRDKEGARSVLLQLGRDLLFDAFGAGALMTVKELAAQLEENRRRRREARRGASDQSRKALETMSEEILDRLSQVFDTRKTSIPRVPMVVFLDDVHFASSPARDSDTLLFLNSFVRKAFANSWPVLFIATHWKAEWLAHSTAGALPSSNWRGVCDIFIQEDARYSNGVHDRYLGKLKSDNLRQVALDHLPGLNERDLSAILKRIDNVRWLTELVQALSDQIECFQENNRRGALSNLGHDRLHQLLQSRSYLEVIRQRLKGDTMRGVRTLLGAIAWHAHGLEFVSELSACMPLGLSESADVAEAHRVVAETLWRAIDPACLLESESTVVGAGMPELVRFPERGYLEVAKELFDRNQLPAIRQALGLQCVGLMQPADDGAPAWQRTFPDDRTRTVFLKIAVTVLETLQPKLTEAHRQEIEVTERSLRRQLAKGKIQEQEIAVRLKELEDELLAELDEVDTVSATAEAKALAELCVSLADAGDGSSHDYLAKLAVHGQAAQVVPALGTKKFVGILDLCSTHAATWPAARKWIENFQRLYEKCPVSMLRWWGVFEFESGNHRHAKDIFSDALSQIKNIGPDESESELLHIKAILLRLIGDCETSDANIGLGKRAFEQSIAVWQELIEKFGESRARLKNMTFPQIRFADCEADAVVARSQYVSALTVREQLLAETPDAPDTLLDVAIVTEKIGELDEKEAHFDAARERFRQALDLRKRVIALSGPSPTRLSLLAASHLRVADIDYRQGNLLVAVRGFRQCVSMLEECMAQYGLTPRNLRDLIVPLQRLASIEARNGNVPAALGLIDRAREVSEQLIGDFGSTPDRVLCLLIVLQRSGSCHETNGDVCMARAQYLKATEIAEQLIEVYSGVSDRMKYLSGPFEALGKLEASAANSEKAESYFNRARQLQAQRSFTE